MKLRKILAVGLVFGMVCTMAACTPKENTEGGTTTDQPAKPQESTVTITFATNVVGAKADALEAACKDFEATTGYTIDFQAPGSSYEELMKTKMSANELPDVFTTHGWSVARYSDYLMPVNELDWVGDISDQIKPVITSKDGDIFVLPMDMDIAGIVCNMTVLEEAGVNPDDIKTWDDFSAACGKIKDAGKIPVHMGGKDNWTIGQYFDWAAPSFYITDESNSKAEELKAGTFDAEVWKEVSGLMDEWVKAGYFNEDVLTADYNMDMQALADGSAAFCFYGNSAGVDARGINPDVKIGMIPIPAVSASDEPSLIAGEDVAVGVWKDSPVKDAAIELLNYLAKPEVIKAISEAAGNKAGMNGIAIEIGDIGEYYDKYSHVETFPYFDREYLPSGMWDVMCATGADILAQKGGAVDSAAQTMEQNFNDKFAN